MYHDSTLKIIIGVTAHTVLLFILCCYHTSLSFSTLPLVTVGPRLRFNSASAWQVAEHYTSDDLSAGSPHASLRLMTQYDQVDLIRSEAWGSTGFRLNVSNTVGKF